MNARIPRFHIDRLEMLGRSFNVLREDEKGYWLNHCKKGNLSWKRAYYFDNPVTWLNTCDVCRKTSTPKKVHARHNVYGWDWDRADKRCYLIESKYMLCMGCWNKVRPIVARERDAYEIQRLINQLTKEIRKCQKSRHPEN